MRSMLYYFWHLFFKNLSYFHLLLCFIDRNIKRFAAAILLITATKREATKLLVDVQATSKSYGPSRICFDEAVMVCLEVVGKLYAHRQQLICQVVERVYDLCHFHVIVILCT